MGTRVASQRKLIVLYWKIYIIYFFYAPNESCVRMKFSSYIWMGIYYHINNICHLWIELALLL